LALALVRAKRLPEAATHLERAVALAPDDAPSAVAWALYLSDTGDGRRALAVLEAALARRPYDIELLMNLTQLAPDPVDRPGTIEALHRLEALLPWEPRFRAERERLEKEKGR
jgi:tetratricopeptide (TPR) repeat protein